MFRPLCSGADPAVVATQSAEESAYVAVAKSSSAAEMWRKFT